MQGLKVDDGKAWGEGGGGHTSFAVTPRVVFTSSKVGQDSGKERRMSPLPPPPK